MYRFPRQSSITRALAPRARHDTTDVNSCAGETELPFGEPVQLHDVYCTDILWPCARDSDQRVIKQGGRGAQEAQECSVVWRSDGLFGN